jgi:hypothetical protein
MLTGGSMERFEEIQSFTQVGVKSLLLPLAIALAGLAVLVFIKRDEGGGGSSEMLLVSVLVLVLVAVGVPLLLMKIRLVVRIDLERLLIHYYPFNRPRLVPLQDIASWEVREYRPLRDYGGWGVKYSLTRGEWSYTVSGNRGVHIRLKNGKAFLVGSQRADEFAAALAELVPRRGD